MIRVASILAVLLWLLPSLTHAEGLFRGQVVSVADGDTVTVRADTSEEKFRVRLEGIDAPERTQPFSQVSRRNLEALVKGKAVTVATTKVDRYNRLVAVVSVDGVPDVGLKQIEAGLAWHFKRYELEQRTENRASYAAAEAIAKAARRGLWQQEKPLPPWEFRANSGTPAVVP